MQRVRIFTGEDGESHFDGLLPEGVSELGALVNGPATVEILDSPMSVEFGPGARRELAIIMSGVHEYRVSDDVRRLFPGDIVMIDDLTGHGHTFAAIGAERAISMRFPLPSDTAAG
jgi:hypothetical protein